MFERPAGYGDIQRLLDRVRARWRRLVVSHVVARAALGVAGALGVALMLSALVRQSPVGLAMVAGLAVLGAVGAVVWAVWPALDVPSDLRVARFIEERDGTLDDRLVTAVSVGSAGRGGQTPAVLADRQVEDAARRAVLVEPTAIVPGDRLRRAALQGAGAVGLVLLVLFVGRDTARQSIDAASLVLFPERLSLSVEPGNARVPAGTPLTITARLDGNRAPIAARIERMSPGGDDGGYEASEMTAAPEGAFSLSVPAVTEPFQYRIVAGPIVSPVYDVTVARAPRVARIDVEYVYPPALGLKPRTEPDTGDIYAPAGTSVRLTVHTDAPAAAGRLALTRGEPVSLTPHGDRQMSASLQVREDGSYRVALSGADGLSNPGDTEYFIRTIEDRAPEVRLLRPARDRTVTRLEEVAIEAEAEDDFGVDALELVYAVRGGAERMVPLRIRRGDPSVTAGHTLYLEDLDVEPGDFVSYYVRARDASRGRRSVEARSDIFFLEVKPFEQEFTLATSQGGGGGQQDQSLDDLVNAQKEVIVATWKLDRRAQTAGARPEQDIKAVARAEAALKQRVEQTASAFREGNMRDPRRQPGPPRPGPTPMRGLRAGQTLGEEDAMTAAAAAMGRAVEALDQLRTRAAVDPEMEALNHLLRAQAQVKQRQVTRQQAGSGTGSNRTSQDLSTLFDRELQRQQQTNYERPASGASRPNEGDRTLERIKELARRQDELLRQQQELARTRDGMSPEALKRALERLSRDQSALREQAEQAAREMSSQSGSRQQSQSQSGRGSQSSTPSSGGSSSTPGDQMKQASEDMRNAATELSRQNTEQASQQSARALQRLEQAARQAGASSPDEQRRALGDMQLEARQLAEAQRQAAAELQQGGRAGTQEGQGAPTDADAMRRMAGDQQRLADRAERLQERMNAQAGSAAAGRELQRDRAIERMREAADQLRRAAESAAGAEARGQASPRAGRAAAGDTGSQPEPASGAEQSRAERAAREAQAEASRALDRAARALAEAGAPGDRDGRRLSDQGARAQQLREQMDATAREIEALGESKASGATPGAAQAELERLQRAFEAQSREARRLLDEMRREDPDASRGGAGFTFEGPGMITSAPGTEAFKQDFARWEQLRRQATLALAQAEASAGKRLAAQASRDRLAAGLDDRAPAGYERQVDDYFKAIAGGSQP
jgi:hypothetical protein